MSILVVVADASRARILSTREDPGELYEVEDLVHPESRQREQDLVAEGMGSDSGGYGRQLMGHENAAHEREADIFAKELCDLIDKRRQHEKLRRVYLVAAPHFLGLLRARLSKQCTSLVSDEVAKNLVTHSLEDIRSHLPKRL